MLSKAQIKHNALQYWLRGEKMHKENIESLTKAAEYETDKSRLSKLLKWERNNINKAIRAHNEVLKLRAEGVR